MMLLDAFADVDNRMTIAREEILGPVLSVIPYRDDEDAAIPGASLASVSQVD